MQSDSTRKQSLVLTSSVDNCDLRRSFRDSLRKTHKWTQNLPKIPIPPLSQTLTRYLETMKSVLPYTEYQKTAENVLQFAESTEARHLQRLLETYAFQKDNWASEMHNYICFSIMNNCMLMENELNARVTELWLDDMYLRNQVPLPVNSNPAFLFPRQTFDNIDQMIHFAASFVQFSVHFKRQLERQLLSQDTVRGPCDCTPTDKKTTFCKRSHAQPLCMQTYTHLFSLYRQPGEQKDTLCITTPTSNYIVVACRNQFFILSLENGQIPLHQYLIQQLQHIWQNATDPKAPACPVGLFTTEHRKTWFHIKQSLLKKAINVHSLHCIERCMYILCIDDASRAMSSSGWLSEAQQLARILHGSSQHSANRWFDKFFQMIIGTDGVCGILSEHSGSEGLTLIRFAEAFLDHWQSTNKQSSKCSEAASSSTSKMNNLINKENSANRSPICNESPRTKDKASFASNARLQKTFNVARNCLSVDVEEANIDKHTSSMNVLLPVSVNCNIASPSRLQWKLDEYDSERLVEAELHLNSLIDGVDLHTLHFTHFGRDWIKQSRFSPDAFIQLALQVTFYKLNGKLTSTYESASLRRFRYGRVDNIRSNTAQALLLARAMCDELHHLPQDKVALFENAMQKQVEIMSYTISGQGIDNHLLGIREMALRHDGWQNGSGLDTDGVSITGAETSARRTENLPRLFTEYSFKQFVNFQLSTSQVASSKGIIAGYGAVVRNGYGCCYNPMDSEIVFMISSFLGGYNVQTNTYNNYNSNYNCSDEKISRSSLFAIVLETTLLQLQELAIAVYEKRVKALAKKNTSSPTKQ